MSETVTLKATLTPNWTHTRVEDLDSFPLTKSPKYEFQPTLAQMYAAQRTVTPATPNDDLDLVGVLENLFGTTINFAAVKMAMIVNLNTTTGHKLLIGQASPNPWTAPFNGEDGIAVCGPGGLWVASDVTDGLTVSSGSSDVLRVAHGGGANDIDYVIYLFGNE